MLERDREGAENQWPIICQTNPEVRQPKGVGGAGGWWSSRTSGLCKEDWGNAEKNETKERAQLQIELINRKLIGSHANASAPNGPNSAAPTSIEWVPVDGVEKFRFLFAAAAVAFSVVVVVVIVKLRFVFISFNSIRVG